MKVQNILDTLLAFGEIAHWTMCPDPDVGHLSCPPIITWRYKQASNGVADFFKGVVSGYRGAISWHFSATTPTWCLMPSRVKEYANTHEDIGGLGAAEELMRKEPDFGKLANTDLWLLVKHIQHQIASSDRCNGLMGQGNDVQ